jgi:hypothetical protein
LSGLGEGSLPDWATERAAGNRTPLFPSLSSVTGLRDVIR